MVRYYKVAVGAYPTHSTVIVKYANLLKSVKKDYDSAEEYYKQAIKANPRHAESLGSYAVLLHGTRQQYDVRRQTIGATRPPASHRLLSNAQQAEVFYKRAIEAAPAHTNNLGNYALFLADVRQQYSEAEELYQRAIASDPNHANSLYNYAVLLDSVRNDYDQVACCPAHLPRRPLADHTVRRRKPCTSAPLLPTPSMPTRCTTMRCCWRTCERTTTQRRRYANHSLGQPAHAG